MSMMFNALRALEMEQREEQGGAFLSQVQFLASTVNADDLSAYEQFTGQLPLKAEPSDDDSAGGESKMDREQLEALRRQVEEDYKLDIAAIDRLQRRYSSASSSGAGSDPRGSTSPDSYSQPDEWADSQTRTGLADSPLPSALAERQSDAGRRSAQTNVQRWPQ